MTIMEWVVSIGIGVVIVALIGVIYALWDKRLTAVETLVAHFAATYLTRAEYDKLSIERADRMQGLLERIDEHRKENHIANQQFLARIEAKIDSNDRETTDRRHDMYARLDEICQRLAMVEAAPGDPRLRGK